MVDLTAYEALLEENAEELYENAPCGYLSTLPDGTIVKVNATLLDWTGYDRADLLRGKRFSDLLTAGGRIFHETHYAPLLRMQGTVREIALDLVRADGTTLPVLVNSVMASDESGTPLIVRTTVFDATQRKEYERELLRARRAAEESEARVRVLQRVVADLAAVPTVTAAAGAVARVAADAYGATASAVWLDDPATGTWQRVAATGADAAPESPPAEAAWAEAVRQREPHVTNGGPLGGDDATAVVVPLVGDDRVLGVAALGFAAERSFAPAELDLLRTLGRQVGQAVERARLHEQAAAETRRAAFLLRASSVLAAAVGFTETLERLADIAVPALGSICLIDVLTEDGRLDRVAARHADPARQPLVDRLRQQYPPDATAAYPSVGAVADRQTRWAATMSEEFLRATARDDEHRALVADLDFTGYVAVPLVTGDDVTGAVTVVRTSRERPFTPEDVALAEQLAAQVALFVQKTRRYETERRTSHTLQAALLPVALPDVPGLAVAVRYLPGTRDVEVGGDFYEVLLLDGGRVAIAVGDVAGHDIRAAATMGQLRSASRALVAGAAGPADLIRRLQDGWELLGLDRMTTAVFGELDPATGALRLASAGHPPPLLLHGSTAAFVDVEPAAPLGAPATAAAEWSGVLPPGATLLLYTDGLVESRTEDIDVGRGRLVAAALRSAATDPDELCDDILAEVSGERRSDDVALLAVRYDGPRRP